MHSIHLVVVLHVEGFVVVDDVGCHNDQQLCSTHIVSLKFEQRTNDRQIGNNRRPS